MADICKRSGVNKLLWKADRNLIWQVDKQNMTAHRWFKAKACLGDYLYRRMGNFAESVNRRLEKNMILAEAEVGLIDLAEEEIMPVITEDVEISDFKEGLFEDGESA